MILPEAFSTPAKSNRTLATLPTFSPVPSGAGFNRIFDALYFNLISCGKVLFLIGTLIKCFLAKVIAFWIAGGTSCPRPKPIHTLPFLSPTATKAEKVT